MKVSFTQKEYARLLELAYLGMWVAGAHGDDGAPAPRYAELEQKLYALATPLGCADYVDGEIGGEAEGLLVPALRLEEEPAVRKAIDDYDEAMFWDGLVERLAERDYARELAKSPLPAEFTEDQRDEHMLKRLTAFEDRYWGEFEKNGIDHLVTLFDTDRLS